jgi:hypothetical protein
MLKVSQSTDISFKTFILLSQKDFYCFMQVGDGKYSSFLFISLIPETFKKNVVITYL